MTPASDLLATLARNDRAVDAERREFAQRASAIILRRSSTGVFDALSYALAMREIDRLMGEFYGQFAGDQRARFLPLILEQCRVARALAFGRAVQDVRRRLPQDLMRAIEAEAA